MTVPLELGDSPWLQGNLTPRLQWYYQSSERYAGPELLAARQSGYNLLNARLTYSFMEGQASVSLWAKNLTDRELRDWFGGLASAEVPDELKGQVFRAGFDPVFGARPLKRALVMRSCEA